jgi:type I restriction-modification system DNA methylase subunit
VLFINASEHFTKDKRQNRLDDRHIDKIVNTYRLHTGIPVEKNSLAGKPITVSICPSLSNFVRIIASAPPRNKMNTYRYRVEEARYSRRVELSEIEKNDFNLNISRYVSTAKPEKVINLAEVNQALAKTESDIKKFTDEHNAYLKELGVNLLKSP